MPVPPERVWTALTREDQLGAWFGTSATIDLRPGGEVVFIWDGSTGPRGVSRGVIETVEPTHRLAFRWQANPGHAPMTRVEFTLEAHVEGTRLLVVESGFASLPPDWRTRERHVQGWQRELSELTSTWPLVTRLGADKASDAVFAVLADPTRRRVLRLVAERGPTSATVLERELPVSRQAIVKHLAVLHRAGLVTGRRTGQEVRYGLVPEPLDEIADWIAETGAP